MSITLTESEKKYLNENKTTMNTGYILTLARLLNRPVEEVSDIIKDANRAVEEHYIGR